MFLSMSHKQSERLVRKMARKMNLNLKRTSKGSATKESRHRVGDYSDALTKSFDALSGGVSSFLDEETNVTGQKLFGFADTVLNAAKRLSDEAGKFTSDMIIRNSSGPNLNFVAHINGVFLVNEFPVSLRQDRRNFLAFVLLDPNAKGSDRTKGKRIIDPVSTEDLTSRIKSNSYVGSEDDYWKKIDDAATTAATTTSVSSNGEAPISG